MSSEKSTAPEASVGSSQALQATDEDNVKSCWVCFATEADDRLAAWVQPCKCIGTTKWVSPQKNSKVLLVIVFYILLIPFCDNITLNLTCNLITRFDANYFLIFVFVMVFRFIVFWMLLVSVINKVYYAYFIPHLVTCDIKLYMCIHI